MEPQHPTHGIKVDAMNRKPSATYHAAILAVKLDPANAAPAIDWIRTHLRDDNLLASLQELGPNGKVLLPELKQLLDPADSKGCSSAIRALEAIGPEAADALPSLRRLERAKDPGIRSAAAKAVQKIEKASAGASPVRK